MKPALAVQYFRQTMRKKIIGVAICFATVLVSSAVLAEEKALPAPGQSIPQPLTLDYVLSTVDDNHPDVQSAQAQVDYQIALQNQVESETGLNITLQGKASYIEPPAISPDQSNNDSRLSLLVQKNLYDFGRSNAASAAAVAEVKGSEQLLMMTKNKHRIDIMAAFFEVLLADLTYIRDNEAMATAYVQYDHMRQRNKVGERSDIDVMELKKDYEEARRKLYTSRSRQRSTRSRLANMMNRPGELVAEVADPTLKMIDEKPGDVDQYLRLAEENNTQLKALRLGVQAAENRVKSARAGIRPVLKGRLEVSDYAREMGGYNDYEASLILDVPLWTGGAVQAGVAKETANLQRLRAQLRAQEMQVQQAVLETWQALDNLRAEREETQSLMDYRDLYLDRSRALYDMEVKTDLGDSMVKISDAQLRMARAKYKTALALAKLNALMGRPVYPFEALPGTKSAQAGKVPGANNDLQKKQKSEPAEEPKQ